MIEAIDNYEIEILIDALKKGDKVRFKSIFGGKQNYLFHLQKYINYANKEDLPYIKILIQACEHIDKDLFYLKDPYSEREANYTRNIRTILNLYSKDKDAAVKETIKHIKNKESITDWIERFNNRYINASLYIPTLNAILDEANKIYETTYDNKPKRTTYINRENIKRVGSNNDLYEKVYESGLSLLDYAFYHLVDTNKYKGYFQLEMGAENKEIANAIASRENKTIPLILDVINRISNEDIDIFEYYELTKLNPLMLRNIARENGVSNGKLSKFIAEYGNPKIDTYAVENEVNAKMVIGQEEVSEEIKLQAKQYLIDNEIPMNTKNYKNMVRKLVKSKSN